MIKQQQQQVMKRAKRLMNTGKLKFIAWMATDDNDRSHDVCVCVCCVCTYVWLDTRKKIMEIIGGFS